jgi:pimeloyl-ACP methyl ester carboxylesterase
MRHHTITGGGGTRLHLVETGNPHGQAVLFIHGFSQCALAWERQLSSDLAHHYRLIAMDMRGHGDSEKPREGYDNSKLWADDVDASIRELSLDRPVLCGWSYGPLVILDYVRHYGEAHIGGIHFVGAITKLGSDAALSVLTSEVLALVPGLFSDSVGESIGTLESFVRMFFAREPARADLYTMLGYNACVPPFVREALFSRILDNDDLLPTICSPVLITHGAADAVVKKEVVEQHRAGIPHARIYVIPEAGHAAFWDNAASFNEQLADFCEEIGTSSAGSRPSGTSLAIP